MHQRQLLPNMLDGADLSRTQLPRFVPRRHLLVPTAATTESGNNFPDTDYYGQCDVAQPDTWLRARGRRDWDHPDGIVAGVPHHPGERHITTTAVHVLMQPPPPLVFFLVLDINVAAFFLSHVFFFLLNAFEPTIRCFFPACLASVLEAGYVNNHNAPWVDKPPHNTIALPCGQEGLFPSFLRLSSALAFSSQSRCRVAKKDCFPSFLRLSSALAFSSQSRCRVAKKDSLLVCLLF